MNKIQKLKFRQRLRKKEDRELPTNDESSKYHKHIRNIDITNKLNTIIKCDLLDRDEYIILPPGYKILNLTENDIKNLEQVDGFIFRRRATFINKIQELNKYNFDRSTILSVNINVSQYINLLSNIYYQINDGAKIIKNTVLDIKTIDNNNKNYTYLHKIGISVRKDIPKNILIELINQCIRNNINIVVEIKLIDNSIIIIKNLKDNVDNIKIEQNIDIVFNDTLVEALDTVNLTNNIETLNHETLDDNDKEL